MWPISVFQYHAQSLYKFYTCIKPFNLNIRPFRYSGDYKRNISAKVSTEAHPESSSASEMERFVKIVNGWKLFIFTKGSILDFDKALNAKLLHKGNYRA